MKIAFVNPPLTKEERYGTLAAAGSYSPPLALCTLAAVTRADGHATIIVDAQAEKMGYSQTVERIAAHKSDVVGISATTSSFPSAAILAARIKETCGDTTVIVGGVHISALPEDCLRDNPAIDLGVVGEGEETILELLNALRAGVDLDRVKGIAFRRDGAVVVTETRALIPDLDVLPLPAWDLLPDFPRAYNVQAQSAIHSPSVSVCSSRGCTGLCTFCDRRVFGHRLRAHSAEYVMRLVTDLQQNFGVRDIQFEDDNFMVFRKRFHSVCKMLKEHTPHLSWSCQARVDMVRPEMLTEAAEAGCWMILYGVESGSQKVLDAMKKEITIEQVEQATEMTHKAGIRCKGFFITGFLNEDHESLAETYRFMGRCKLDDISNHFFCPFPGSVAREEAHKYGTLRGESNDMTFYRPVFIPNGLTEQDLVRHIKACYRRFYMRPRILWGYLRRIRNVKDLALFVKSGLVLLRHVFFK